MSELKVYKFLGQDEVWPDANLGSDYYLKSEADKVIAELKDKLQAADEQIENLINNASSIMLSQDMVNDDKCAELRHCNYKRCLAMARWCDEMMMSLELRGCTIHPMFAIRHRWAMRWKYRWLELAEKFKEAK